MSYSLNEISAMAKKAARGAGYSWSLADEAGRAARRLTEMGFDGCAALTALLTSDHLCAAQNARLKIEGQAWRVETGPLCPLAVGTALSDRRGMLQFDPAPLQIDTVLCPLLVLPFLGAVSAQLDQPLTLRAEAQSVVVFGMRAVRSPALPQSAPLAISACGETPPEAEITRRATPTPQVWEQLSQLAHRTYAPATDASRAKGAGGDLPDTD